MDAIRDLKGAKGRWLGRGLRRVEDDRLVAGRGAYVDDHSPEGCLYLEFVRGPYPHARVTRIDLEAARKAAGVVAVFTARDLGELGPSLVNTVFPDMAVRPIRLLAGDVIEALGQAVAAVVATSRDAASDAAQLVGIEAETLVAAAPRHGAEALAVESATGGVDEAFAGAAHVVTARVEHALVAPTPIEPRAALADWRDGRLTAWLSTQAPFRAREDIARVLRLPMSRVRVIAPDVGGAFGGKSSIFPEDLMVAWAARRLAAPVKWCATRGEDLLAATHGRGAETEGELALAADGTMLALRARMIFPLGHWMPYSAAIPVRNASRILPGPYRIPAVAVRVEARLGNHAAVGIYRGAGRPEAAMLMERLVEAAARALDIDPIELRRRNVVEPSAFPWHAASGETLDSGDYPALLEKVARIGRYRQSRAWRDTRRNAGEVVGIGLALYIEPCGQGWESASAALCRDGSILVATGSSAQGQGRETAFAQIAADALSVEHSRVAVRQGDTADLASGIGALASRSTAIGGSAVLAACEGLRAQVAEAAAERLNCTPGDIVLAGDMVLGACGRSIGWEDLARHVAAGDSGDGKKPVLINPVVYHAEGEAWASGCCMAVVRVDRETGEIRIEDLLWVDDAGIVVNPLLVEGQLVGGMAQGLGEALMERVVYDEDGQLLTGSLMDYAVPRAADIPAVRIEKIETPSPANALGAKGVGEAGCIGVPAAIANAVRDALAPFGPGDLQMPFTSEKIWRVLQRGEAGRTAGGKP